MGVTTRHLDTSLHTASMYGRQGLSSNVGNRSLPTTASSSALVSALVGEGQEQERDHRDGLNLIVGVSKKSAGFARTSATHRA